ncbi:hypothetical protein RhiirA5_408868 [Rhizophagus irregularis]|uniref:Uncharacterized protein n=1 Tax=Rhizophagus irregularis TaxID=588596 RepID=A0A2N0Q724_9GLOM|nr:hypothetical protein RhiirA5_408868 [Rhizophagus irregularis]
MSNSNQQRLYKKENYSISLEIIYYDNQKFVYNIIQEGIYLSAMNYIETPNYFPISDNYIIKTTWNQANNSFFSAQSPFNASVELHKIEELLFLSLFFWTSIKNNALIEIAKVWMASEE